MGHVVLDLKRESRGELIAPKKRIQNSVLKPLRAIFYHCKYRKMCSEKPSFKVINLRPGVVAHACNFNTQKDNAGESPKVSSSAI